MNYLRKTDTWLATLLVFAFIGLLKVLFPLNLYVFDPVKAAMTDIRFNDLAFSKFRKKAGIDSNLVLVNIGEADRSRISEILNAVKAHRPKVTGLDIMLPEASPDSAADRRLERTIRGYPNLVLAEQLQWENGRAVVRNHFADASRHKGYINLIGEKEGVIRHYSPFERETDRVHKSFSSAVLELADSVAYARLLKRGRDYEMIDYRRRLDDYLVLEVEDFERNRIEPGFLKDRTVLLGYLNPDPDNIVDKHFTPMNDRFIGKSRPDLNGMVIHANILSMTMDGTYIRQTPGWLSILMAVLGVAVLMAILIDVFLHRHVWFHLYYKLLQLATGFLVIFLGTLLLSRGGLYIDFTLLLLGLALSVDMLYIYAGLVVWFNRRFGFKTLFPTKDHR